MLGLFVAGVVEEAVTLAERWPISAPRPTASAIVCVVDADGVGAEGVDGVAVGTGATVPAVGEGLGAGVAAVALPGTAL